MKQIKKIVLVTITALTINCYGIKTDLINADFWNENFKISTDRYKNYQKFHDTVLANINSGKRIKKVKRIKRYSKTLTKEEMDINFVNYLYLLPDNRHEIPQNINVNECDVHAASQFYAILEIQEFLDEDSRNKYIENALELIEKLDTKEYSSFHLKITAALDDLQINVLNLYKVKYRIINRFFNIHSKSKTFLEEDRKYFIKYFKFKNYCVREIKAKVGSIILEHVFMTNK